MNTSRSKKYPMIKLSNAKGEMLQEILFQKESLTLGRDQGNDICIPDHKVSKLHARLEKRGERIFVVDLNSKNGVDVAGRTVPPGEEGIMVTYGQVIRLGDHEAHIFLPVQDGDQQIAGMDETLEAKISPYKKEEPVRKEFRWPFIYVSIFVVILGMMMLLYRKVSLIQTLREDTNVTHEGKSSTPDIPQNKKEDINSKNNQPQPKGDTVKRVFKIVFVKRGEGKTIQKQIPVVATGAIKALKTVTVYPKISGTLESIAVKEGEEVKEGSILTQLDQKDFKFEFDLATSNKKMAVETIKAYEIELVNSESNLLRNKGYFKNGYISKAELDRAVAAVESCKARLSIARETLKSADLKLNIMQERLDDTLIKAPFAGVVSKILADVGETVSPTGDGILIVTDRQKMGVAAQIDEGGSQINVGSKARVVPATNPDKEYTAQVHTILPQASGSVMVELDLLPQDIVVMPGMAVTVYFDAQYTQILKTPPKLYVPAAAVLRRGGNDYVFVVKDKKAWEKKVKRGEISPEGCEIEGLDGEEEVILDPPEDLQDGSVVKSD